MRKSLIQGSIFTLTLAVCFSSVFADDTPADLSTVSSKVVNLQGNDTGLPSGVPEQKGTVGTILAKIFETTGKIGNYYIKALDAGNRAGSTGKVLKWNGGTTGNFADSLIWDTGSNIGINAIPSPVFATSQLRLDVNGNVGANNYCDENGGNCFTAAEANVTGAIIGGGGTANYITKFTGTGATIGNSLLQDDGSTITSNSIINANAGILVDGRPFVSGGGDIVTAYRSSGSEYGILEAKNTAGQRGLYLGWGNGGAIVDLFIDTATTLAIGGGDVTMSNNLSVAGTTALAGSATIGGTLGVTGTVSGATPTAATHLTTKGYVDAAITSGVSASSVWTTSGTNIYNSNTGNVGIGTATPTKKFVIAGTHVGTEFQLYSVGDGGTNDARLNLWASEPAASYTGVGISNNVRNYNGSLPFIRENTSLGGSYIRLLDNVLAFNTVSNSGVDIRNMTLSNGYVGIGTATPSRKLDVAGDMGVRGNIYTDNNYGNGLVGLYASTIYQGIFSMGDSYKLPANGSSPGNLYGISWTHTNVGGESKGGLSHQALFMANGITQTAIGSGIWTLGQSTMNNVSPTTYYQDTDNRSAMIHVNSNTFYILRGDGTNSNGWSAFAGRWPLTIDLETNRANFGGTVQGYATAVAQEGIVGYSQNGAVSGRLGYNNTVGVQGETSSAGGYGVVGYNYGAGYGVYGQSAAQYGVTGRTTSASYGGVLGYNHDASTYAILGYSNNYSLYGNGQIYVSGNIQTAGSVKTTCVGNCF